MVPGSASVAVTVARLAGVFQDVILRLKKYGRAILFVHILYFLSGRST